MDGTQRRIDGRRRVLILGASAALLPLRAHAQGEAAVERLGLQMK